MEKLVTPLRIAPYPEKPAITRTLVAVEGVEHLDRLAREAMVVELSDGRLFVSAYDNNSEKSPDPYLEITCCLPVNHPKRQQAPDQVD